MKRSARFDSESDQTKDLKIGTHASLIDVQYCRDSVRNKPVVYLMCNCERYLTGLPHLYVIHRWLAALEQATTTPRFLVMKNKNAAANNNKTNKHNYRLHKTWLLA